MLGAACSAFVLLLASGGPAFAAPSPTDNRMALFDAAAKEFNVPVNVLVALSYNESRLEVHSGVSVDGGYGLMNLRTYTSTAISGRDGSKVLNPKKSADYYTLDRAAKLLNISTDQLKTDSKQNIRGAAAVLAEEAKRLNDGKVPASVGDWYGAVAAFGGAAKGSTTTALADSVFASIASGLSVTTTDGQKLSIPATNLQSNDALNSVLNRKSAPRSSDQLSQNVSARKAECPRSLDCRFVPAAYAQNSEDPKDFGNWDPANRPQDMKVKYIIIHDTEGSYESAIAHFQDPKSYVSSHYVVRSSDGAVTQMVKNSDVAWTAGDWYVNMHGINIENEGIAANGAAWYTEEMYQTNAKLVRYLANKYDIPLDREHIIGHDNVPTLTAARMPGQHWDPGPFWDWDYFMDLVRGDKSTDPIHDNSHRQVRTGDVVTIAPNFVTNKPPLTDCQTGTCVDLPSQGASFVYLHKEPSDDAPLLSDKYVHQDNSDGTTRDDDWGDKAPSGFKYVVADVQGDWTAIWFGGQKGWFYNPEGSGRTAYRSHSVKLAPKPGLDQVPVYGAAYPEDEAYPSTIPVQQFDELYHIEPGQLYATTFERLQTDYFYDATVNYSLPDDHMIVRGNTRYYQISLNHRIGYVKASDVVVR